MNATPNHATLAVVRNPFHPAIGREQRDIAVGRPLTDLVPAVGVFVVCLNGQYLLRADWGRRVAAGDVVAIIHLPRGGGKGGSNPLKIVLSLAIAVVAPQISLSIWGEAGAIVLAGGVTVGGLTSAAIGLAGNVLINALAGGAPRGTSPQQAAAMAAPSPTYNLQAQGNMARLDAAIPVQYGRLAAYPDFAALPYVEYAGNEQFLYQLLCLGAGEYDIEQIRIEDTAIDNWDEITSEIIGPHGTVDLFPTNVDTAGEVAGQEMEYNVYLGPFAANSAGTDATALGLDFIFPRGLYYANPSGGLSNIAVTWTVEAREIDDDGNYVGGGSYTTLGSETFTAATSTPQRLSRRYSVAAARYEVRVKRTSTKYTAPEYGNDINWAGLRAYLPDTRDFGDVTLIALRMKATNNLSAQASRKINVIATRKLPAWDGSAFGTASATSSIAWALANICTDATWGAGLADARVDLDGLLALDAIWAARGDEFNGRFDNTLSFWEALTKIARAGRAYPYMQGGIIRFSRDAAQTTPVALFSMRNIVRGSFRVQYLTPSEAMADAIDVAYFDDSVWAPRRVQAKLTGSTAAKPVKIDLFGVTDRDQAFREGVYEAAVNRYRRKVITFSTDMEGFIPSFGDLIAIAHDMPQWGQTAEVTAVTTGNNLIPYSEDFTQWAGTATTTADTMEDAGAGDYEYTFTLTTGAFSGVTVCGSLYIEKDAIGRATRFPILRLQSVGGGTHLADLYVDTMTGESATNVNGATLVDSDIEDAGDYWRAWIACAMTDAAITGAGVVVLPAAGASAGWSTSLSATGTITAYGAQLEVGSAPGPYVPTDASPVTDTTVLTVNEPMTWDTGTHYVGLRARDGSVDGPIALLDNRQTTELVLAAAPSFTPYTGQAEERTHIVFGAGETWRQPARVLSVRPRGLERVEIECINDDPGVHTAEDGLTSPAVTYSQLDTRWTAPVIEGLTAWSHVGAPDQMLLSWRPAPGADHYLVEQSSDGETWTRTGEPSTSNYTALALYGNATLIRIAAVGLTRGPWVTIGYGGFADYMWSATDTDLMWSATDTDQMWMY